VIANLQYTTLVTQCHV